MKTLFNKILVLVGHNQETGGGSEILDLSSKLLEAHITHIKLIIFWIRVINLFEIGHFVPEKPM